MVKRIASSGWRVGVAADGKIFSMGVRSDTGRDYEFFFITADSSPIISELLRRIAEAHRALPPRTFAEGEGPDHPLAGLITPNRVTVAERNGQPALAIDFGGTVLTVAIDPDDLARQLGAPRSP